MRVVSSPMGTTDTDSLRVLVFFNTKDTKDTKETTFTTDTLTQVRHVEVDQQAEFVTTEF